VSLVRAFDDRERIRQATDIVDLVGSYLDLRRQGSLYVARCPWHDDHRPSLQVNPARQTWKCWVCNLGGDIFSFVMQRENVDFRQALQILADRAGISLARGPRRGPAADPDDKRTLYEAMAWVEQQYHVCLTSGAEAARARDYLRERGITDEAVNAFRLGFAPDQFGWLVDRARSTSFTPTVLESIGVLKSGDRAGVLYDRFRGRIIFPIRDAQDRSIGFGGRVMPQPAGAAADASFVPAKYINSPETRLFSKSDTLYGLNVARRATQQRRELVVMEGYTDVIAAWQSGLDNAVAVLGTALNSRHIRVLKRLADRVTLVLDGDDAGQRRANEILELFLAQDVNLRVVTLPDGMDPFDFLRAHGAHQLRQLIDDAVDALEHKIQIETRGVDLIGDSHRANQALERILAVIAPSGSAAAPVDDSAQRLKQDQILTRLARVFHADTTSLRRRLDALRRRPHRDRPAPTAEAPPQAPPPRREVELLEILLRRSQLAAHAAANIDPEHFTPGPLREIYAAYYQSVREGGDCDFSRIMTILEDPALKNVLVRLDDEAQRKTEWSSADDQTQLEAVIQGFVDQREMSHQRRQIDRLGRKQLDAKEEASILNELLARAKQRQIR